jgi:hypothetical protein
MRALLWLTLVLFSALTAEVLWIFGYIGFVEWAFYNLATTLVFVDLVIALTMVMVVMVRHAQANGLMVWPYILLTLGFGSAGPLLYFARHWRREGSGAGQLATRPATEAADLQASFARRPLAPDL